MKKLSRPFTEMKTHYDVVVIGSGYGGSIAASRMARCGQKVCLLEKGKEFLPGEFPSTLGEASKEMQFNKGTLEAGSENGLYEFVLGNEINVFKGCGLGGTSLVNANVAIEPDSRVMADAGWPAAIRNNLGEFQEGIRHAWDMLKPSPYPEGKNGYPVLQKTEAMRASAKFMSEEFRLLDINVNFEDRHPNHVGVDQPKCLNCGDCVTGCNAGAKNTTAMNYLPDAVNFGAELYTEVGVKHIERDEARNTWRVYYNAVNSGRDKFNAPSLFVEAAMVFVSGGSLGSTELLLRSARNGLTLSPQLGQKFTGNGDVLGFGYNNDMPIHGVGKGDTLKPGVVDQVGPCITSVIDMRKRTPFSEGMTLEEGSIPGPIRSILVSALVTFSRVMGRDSDRGLGDFFREKWREVVSIFRGPFKGAVDHTQIYLVMTHDDGNGVIGLSGDDEVTIHWKGVGKQNIFKKVSGELASATEALGGNTVPNPTWTKILNYDLVTVHPLGGCPMGDDATQGVVDHKGQAFKGSTGSALYPGLYVMDGAIFPRPVGTNPLLTISALAERNCKLIAQEKGWTLSYDFPLRQSPSNGQVAKPGVQFTETMRGYFSVNEKDDYRKAFEKGKQENSPFEFTLTIRSEDVETLLANKEHDAPMAGTMTAPALSPHPLMACNGRFNLFVRDAQDPERKKMVYNIYLQSREGKKFYFEGFKDVQNNKGLDVWKDTTTLFITVYEESATGKVVGRGQLIIEPKDFAKQLTTMKAINTHTRLEQLKAVSSFGKFFAGNVFETYFKTLR